MNTSHVGSHSSLASSQRTQRINFCQCFAQRLFKVPWDQVPVPIGLHHLERTTSKAFPVLRRSIMFYTGLHLASFIWKHMDQFQCAKRSGWQHSGNEIPRRIHGMMVPGPSGPGCTSSVLIHFVAESKICYLIFKLHSAALPTPRWKTLHAVLAHLQYLSLCVHICKLSFT